MRLVNIGEVKAGMRIARSLEHSGGGELSLLRVGTPLTGDIIQLMKKRGIQWVYIQDEKDRRPSESQDRRPPPGREMTESGMLVPPKRPAISEALRTSAVQSLEAVYKDALIGASDIHSSTAAVIKKLDQVVDSLVDSLDGQSMISIMDLKSYDDYTFSHSLSVAVLTAALAQGMGISGSDVRRIAKSAMLHDIGKTSIPLEIVNKPSRLDLTEFAIMKNHSSAGYDYLAQAVVSNQDDELLRSVLHHHEKMDGSGYPYGINGDKIPLWSRIVAVADVYDALTSNRPYRIPMHAGEAIEYLMGGSGSQFDYDVVATFLKKVEIFPIGTKIELSNGQMAVVYNNENSLRPVVMLTPKGQLLDLGRDPACRSIVIKRVVGS